MRNMVVRLLRNEIAKVSRTKLPYFGIFAACLVCILAFVVTEAAAPLSLPADPGGDVQFAAWCALIHSNAGPSLGAHGSRPAFA